MKKDLLLIAAAATMLTACVNTDNLRDYSIQQDSEDNGGSIAFTSFTDNVVNTKSDDNKAENSEALYTWTFYNHQESFQVWGRKSTQYSNEIFKGTKVTVAPDVEGYTYTYAPARFWDKSASKYHFYAAAPAQPEGDEPAWTWTFNATDITSAANLDKGYFTTSSTLNGVNLQSVTNSGPTAELKNIFKTATLADGTTKDIDKLIAAPCEVAQTYYNRATPNAVNLNFIHILSKLNITISSKLYDASNDYYDVELLDFKVRGIPNKGDFTEKNADFTPHGKNIRWALTSPTTNKMDILTGIDDDENKIEVAEPTAANATGAKTYIVESLIIPQEIEYERIALDGAVHADQVADAVPFADYEEYTQAKDDDVERLTRAQFNALVNAGAFKTWATYEDIEGETLKTDADGEDTFDARILEVTKTPAINIAAYAAPTKPYFEITYSIDGDIFTQKFNLAAAFLGYTNNNQKYVAGVLTDLDLDGLDDNDDPTTFSFYEGWQNTLNIIINPTAIEFTADVAEWSTNANVEYEIEQGNENPNN